MCLAQEDVMVSIEEQLYMNVIFIFFLSSKQFEQHLAGVQITYSSFSLSSAKYTYIFLNFKM